LPLLRNADCGVNRSSDDLLTVATENTENTEFFKRRQYPQITQISADYLMFPDHGG